MKLDSKTQALLNDSDKRWAWLKYQLCIQNITFREIALAAGVKSQTLSKVRHMPYPKMERVLAAALGLSAQELFPERYDADGLPARNCPGRSPYRQAAS